MKNDSKKINKKVLFIIIIAISTLIVAIAGATYAFFSVYVTSEEYMYGSSGYDPNSLKLEIAQVSVGSGNMIPLVDSTLQSLVANSSGNGSCLDNRGNTVCKVYSITITNQSKIKMSVAGTLNLSAPDMPNLKWAKGTSATSGFPTPTGAYYTKSDINIADVSLEANGFSGNSATFYIAIWISEKPEAQGDHGTFVGTVTFSGYTGDIENGVTSAFGG